MLWLAVSIACVSAFMGNRTAWALLAGVSFSRVMDAMPFNPLEWVAVDALMLAAIIRRNMTMADMMICCLFVMAWAFYMLPDPMRHDGTTIIVIAQMLLTFPLLKTQRSLHTYSHGPINAGSS